MNQIYEHNLFLPDILISSQSEQEINYTVMDCSSETLSKNSKINLENSQIFSEDLSSDMQEISPEELSPLRLNSFEGEELELNEKDINNLYFYEKNKNIKNLFNVEKTNKILRGRKRKNSSIKNINKIPHGKNSLDNILRKIQVHYMSFLPLSLNDILKQLNIDLEFCKLDYNFKKIVNKKTFKLLKSKTIGDIIKSTISRKYSRTNDKKKYNMNICDKINQTKYNEVLNNILSINYLKFFNTIYCKDYGDKKIINLKDYGLDMDITLSEKVKTLSDLLKKSGENADKEYLKNIKECIEQYFMN